MVYSRARPHGSHVDCLGVGNTCWHPDDDGGGGTPPDSEFLTRSALPIEERREFHDETLSQLVDDVNKLFREASEKRKDKELSIMFTPKGLFPFWMHKDCPNPNDEKERRSLEKDSDYDYLMLK